MAYNFGLITGSTAKYDATNKVMYIQYDEHSYGTIGNGLAKVSEINNAKAQAIYSIISHDHDAIAYFKSMADLLTADGTPTKASDLMIEASRTKDWETIFKSNLYYSNVKEQLQNAPTSQLDIEDVPTSTIKDDSIFTTTVVEGGHGYDDSGSSNSRKVDKNLRLGISNTLRDTNAKLYDAELLYTQYQDEVLLAQEEYTNNPTPETRNKLETAKRNFDSSSKILQTLTEQREHNLNFLRSAISTVRAENGLTPSNEILTYDEFKTALEKDSNATIYDINKYTDSESTTSKFYAHPKRYKELNSDLPEYIAQETFRLINEEGVSTSKGLLQGIGQSLGIKMQSSDDENAMIQAITYRVFKGAGFSDEDALKYSKPSIKDGLSNRSGVYHFLKQFDNVQKAANNIFDYFKDVEFTIPYDVVMESEDKNAPENAMNNYVSSIIQGATLYDQYGEVVSPDGSSHARFINKIKNMENVTGSATMTILNGMYGIQIRGETALESTSMKNPMVERESTIAFLDNKSSIQLLTKNINNVKLANSKNKELEGSLLPSGLTMTQEKQFAEDEAMLSKSYDGIYLSTISSVLDRAGDKFLASTGGKSETFDHTFDIGENPKVSYNMPGTIKFEYINNTGENEYAQFDYLKRSGKIAMQVTYPTEINGTYRNVNRYVYALGADVTFEQLNNITMSNIPQLQDLEKEGYTNYDIVPTPSGILVLLYESTYSGNVLEDFDNGVDAMVATHYLAKGMETSK
jgi:predicted CopG family antitoxin